MCACKKILSVTVIKLVTVVKNNLQPGLGACAASLGSPGRRVLSDLIGAHRVLLGENDTALWTCPARQSFQVQDARCRAQATGPEMLKQSHMHTECEQVTTGIDTVHVTSK